MRPGDGSDWRWLSGWATKGAAVHPSSRGSPPTDASALPDGSEGRTRQHIECSQSAGTRCSSSVSATMSPDAAARPSERSWARVLPGGAETSRAVAASLTVAASRIGCSARTTTSSASIAARWVSSNVRHARSCRGDPDEATTTEIAGALPCRGARLAASTLALTRSDLVTRLFRLHPRSPAESEARRVSAKAMRGIDRALSPLRGAPRSSQRPREVTARSARGGATTLRSPASNNRQPRADPAGEPNRAPKPRAHVARPRLDSHATIVLPGRHGPPGAAPDGLHGAATAGTVPACGLERTPARVVGGMAPAISEGHGARAPTTGGSIRRCALSLHGPHILEWPLTERPATTAVFV